MAAVQFTNKDDVLEAYKRMKVAPWAIWCGKEMNFSCSDKNQSVCEAELAEYLEMLDRNEMPAYYALRVYDDLDGEKINNKTPYSNSFGFRLTESAAGYKRSAGGDGGMSGQTVGSLRKQWEQEQALINEIKALRMEVQEMRDGDDGDDEDEDYGLGKIGRILQHPTIAPMAQQLLGAFTGMLNRSHPAGQIAGVPGDPEKIQAAMQILTDCIPDFPDILNKLATMAQKQPAQLKLYCNALREMQI
jgi:hypothetical protein